MVEPNSQARRWSPIEPLAADSVLVNGSFAALDALRQEWGRQLSMLPEVEQTARRQRSLRRLAIETGVIERLYEVDWGLTMTLVAEGFAREVVERAGGSVDDRTLATLVAQRETLEIVLDFVRNDRKLTPGFIREVHQAITRTQETYTAVDSLGRTTETKLPHGVWKTWPNHVRREDGTILEYCPPEHVQAEMDRLTAWFEDIEEEQLVHPMVRAAWLHHRFVQIHPFADGNGRVARSLTLLAMQRHHYAPLVVDRFHRGNYVDALDAANDRDLRPLVRLFVSLESSALVGELESAERPARGTSVEVAHTLATQLAARREKETEAIRRALDVRAKIVGGLLTHWFTVKRSELEEVLRSQGGGANILMAEEPSGAARSHYYRRQILDSARRAGHFADLRFAEWRRLVVVVEDLNLKMSYVASLHAAGREPGVMAVTTFAVIGPANQTSADAREGTTEAADISTTSNAFLFVHAENTETLSQRQEELSAFLDSGLTVALLDLMNRT